MFSEARTSRRASSRYASAGTLGIEHIPQPKRLSLKDISHGGFSVVADEPFAPDSTCRFRFHTDPSLSFVVVARTVYCDPLTTASATQRYLAGFAFEPEGAEELSSVVAAILQAASTGHSVH